MWVFFGFITFISFTIYFWYKRLNSSWEGEIKKTEENIVYHYKVTHGEKGSIAQLLIGIDAPEGYDYTLKKESGFDRFVKSIGLSIEHQTGNIKFDTLVYILSDNIQFQKQLSSDGVIVDSFLKIFSFGRTSKCRVQDLQHNSGRLWLTIVPLEGFNTKRTFVLASKIVPLLHTIAKELKTIPWTASKSWKDPFTTKAAILLAISSAMAVNGGIQLVRYINLSNTITLDTDALLIDALMLGFSLSIALALIAVYLLGRSSRTHLILIELLLLGSFGAVVTSYAELNDINITADRSQGVLYKSEIVKKRHMVGGRRTAPKYFLTMYDWNTPAREDKIKIRVGSTLYYAVEKGEQLAITQKEGYFNYRWIESLKKLNDLN